MPSFITNVCVYIFEKTKTMRGTITFYLPNMGLCKINTMRGFNTTTKQALKGKGHTPPCLIFNKATDIFVNL